MLILSSQISLLSITYTDRAVRLEAVDLTHTHTHTARFTGLHKAKERNKYTLIWTHAHTLWKETSQATCVHVSSLNQILPLVQTHKQSRLMLSARVI